MSLEELKGKAKLDFKDIKLLYAKINTENKYQRNYPCPCGSGKKWKRCCIIEHEVETVILEGLIKDYRKLCIEINKKKTDFLVDKHQ